MNRGEIWLLNLEPAIGSDFLHGNYEYDFGSIELDPKSDVVK